jgi:uncharacterized DUF497 family protein
MDFEWDAGNIEHIERRGYTPGDVEDAFRDPRRRVVAIRFRGEMRFLLVGAPAGGRPLTIPYTRRGGRIRPISAYPARGNA